MYLILMIFGSPAIARGYNLEALAAAVCCSSTAEKYIFWGGLLKLRLLSRLTSKCNQILGTNKRNNSDSDGIFRFVIKQFGAEKKSAQRGRKSQRSPYKTIFSHLSLNSIKFLLWFSESQENGASNDIFFVFLNPFPDWHFLSVSSRTPRFFPPWLVDSVLNSSYLVIYIFAGLLRSHGLISI